MSYNHINTSLGLITYINDDNVFSTLNNLLPSSSFFLNLVENDVEQSAYNEFISSIDFNDVYSTVFQKAETIGTDTQLANKFLSTFPNTVFKSLTPSDYESGKQYPVSNNTNKFVVTEGDIFNQHLLNNDTQINVTFAVGGNMVYGDSDTDNSTSLLTSAAFILFIFNSDYSEGFAVHINGTVITGKYTLYARKSYSSASDLAPFFINLNPDPHGAVDPYQRGGTSGNDTTGGTGGTGTLDGSSDNIDFPSLPTLSASSTGFITLFTPTVSQLNALADYMWNNDLFDIDTWKKIFDNPMDAIIGLSIVPVSVPSGGAADVTVGNIITTVSMTKASTQFVEVDCGTLNVQEYWGAYLDYAPYTKCELYLPYCGVHPINTDDIMGKAVHIKYHVDILSGSCVCYVKCGDSVIYSFIGQCSSSIPITGQDMTQVINGALNIAGSVGSLIASGGMSAPISAAMVTGAASSTVSNVMNMKPTVERSGSMSGTGGMLAIQKPYIVMTRPRQCLPANQNTFTGYPSYITRTISTLIGFTKFMDVHLTNIAATDAEKSEIMQLLKEGVIL